MSQWVYEVATGKWCVLFRPAAVYLTDKANYALAVVPDGLVPDPIYERATEKGERRKATELEIAESKADQAGALRSEEIHPTTPLEAIVKQLVADVAALKAAGKP